MLLVIESPVVCGDALGGSGSSSGFALIIWIVDCGHVLVSSVVMSWVCGHLLGLWSFPGSWAVVMSWVDLWSSPGSVVLS